MVSKTEAKAKIGKLVKGLDEIIKRGEHKKLSEDDTRRVLIEPLFEALGWGVRDFRQLRSQIKSHREEGRGLVDYSFQINGVTKFFLEAKPLKADLDDPEYSKQVIDYAWHKSVTWAVLSDFEGIKIFNAEWKEDDVEKNRYKEFTYKEYLPRFEELWLLSKESFEKGLIDKAAEEVGRKIKRRPVGEAIFDDLMGWRIKLLDSIKKLKQIELTDEDIEECVQKILDRLIFIRTCEDRGFEDRLLEGALRKCEQEDREKDLYEEIVKVFKHYYFYNSELFKGEHLCEKLNIFPSTIRKIIEGLYYNHEERIYYNFQEIPADILGGIYEQYLGRILKKGKLAGGRPHRKEKGIYYTPRYIVDYIVKNTVGKLLEELPFNEAKNLKILDPACGSGSFLIRAYEEMEKYLEEKGHKVDFARKVEVLQNNIYGVDLDEQAVEIAQLNLMMNSLTSKVKIPKLSNNIKRGNSLIDDPKVAGDKAFDWKKEFPEVFTPSVVSPLVRGRGAKEGGFDVVIGNPPYVNVENLSPQDRDFMMAAFETASKRFDIFVGFIEKGIKLLKNEGLLAFIIPYPFLTQNYAENLRKYILQNCTIEVIVDLSRMKIFQEAVVKNIVLIIKKQDDKNIRLKHKMLILSPMTIQELIEGKYKSLAQETFKGMPETMFRTDINAHNLELSKKILANSFLFGEIGIASWGARGVPTDKFVLNAKINEFCKKMLRGRDVGRYQANYSGKWFLYDLSKLTRPAFPELFESEKIIVGKVTGSEGLRATYDNDKYYSDSSTSCCILKHNLSKKEKGFFGKRKIQISDDQTQLSRQYCLKYILGIINSNLMRYYFNTFLGYGLNVYPESIEQLPIRKVEFRSSSDKKMYNDLVIFVDEMLLLNKQYGNVKDKQTSETERLKNKIDETDREIDQLVYKLYGLTEKEIGVVEGAGPHPV